MKNSILKIIKECNISEGKKLSPNTEIKKFSITEDLFNNNLNYIVKINKEVYLIPGEYAEIINPPPNKK